MPPFHIPSTFFTFCLLSHQFLTSVYLENFIDLKMSFDSIPVTLLVPFLDKVQQISMSSYPTAFAHFYIYRFQIIFEFLFHIDKYRMNDFLKFRYDFIPGYFI